MKWCYALVFLAIVLLIPSVSPAGGITLYEIGSEDVGLASAGWSARADEPSTAFTNPAGMTRLDCREAELGVQPVYSHLVFSPREQTTVSGSRGRASSWIPAGGTFYVQPINETFAVGASVVGYFGSKINFNSGWVGRYYLTETTLQGFSFVPAAAAKITDALSIGVGANIMYGMFKQKSAINNVLDGLPDGHLRVSNDDVGFGCLIGVLYEISPATRVGFQYLSEVRLQFKCKPHFKNVGPTLAASLASTGLAKERLFLDVHVPQGVMFSAYREVTPSLAVMGNVGWQEWSNFQKATISLASASSLSLTEIPKYKNTWHAAVGCKYAFSESLSFSAGYAYDSSAVSRSNRTLDFPVGRQRRYGLGCEWQMRDNLLVGVQYEYQYQGKLAINTNKGPLVGHVEGRYDSWVNFFNFNVQCVF